MTDATWLYHQKIWIDLTLTFAYLFGVTYLGHVLGRWVKGRPNHRAPPQLAEFVPSTVLGMLALILGFTFSMTITRFEGRRQLVMSESDAIETSYLRLDLLEQPYRSELKGLLRQYLDGRIQYYDLLSSGRDAAAAVEGQVADLQNRIWKGAVAATRETRSPIENSVTLSLNTMFDLRSDRNFALTKTLPPMIYWTILFIAGMGLSTFNFARALRGETGQWQSSILVLMVAFIFILILDIERPTEGTIRITQEAMLDVKAAIERFP